MFHFFSCSSTLVSPWLHWLASVDMIFTYQIDRKEFIWKWQIKVVQLLTDTNLFRNKKEHENWSNINCTFPVFPILSHVLLTCTGIKSPEYYNTIYNILLHLITSKLCFISFPPFFFQTFQGSFSAAITISTAINFMIYPSSVICKSRHHALSFPIRIHGVHPNIKFYYLLW